MPSPQPAAEGDTVWLGAIDAAGRAVSFIQEHLLGIRLRSGAARIRHCLAEPRHELRTRSAAPERAAAPPPPVPHDPACSPCSTTAASCLTARWAARASRRRKPRSTRATSRSGRSCRPPSARRAGRSAAPGAPTSPTCGSKAASPGGRAPIAGCRPRRGAVGAFDEAMGHAGALVLHRGGVRHGRRGWTIRAATKAARRASTIVASKRISTRAPSARCTSSHSSW